MHTVNSFCVKNHLQQNCSINRQYYLRSSVCPSFVKASGNLKTHIFYIAMDEPQWLRTRSPFVFNGQDHQQWQTDNQSVAHYVHSKLKSRRRSELLISKLSDFLFPDEYAPKQSITRQLCVSGRRPVIFSKSACLLCRRSLVINKSPGLSLSIWK